MVSEANSLSTPIFNNKYQSVTFSASNKTAGVALISLNHLYSLSLKREALDGHLLVAKVRGPSLPHSLRVVVA